MEIKEILFFVGKVLLFIIFFGLLFGGSIRIIVNNIRNGRKWGEGLPDDLGE